MKQRQPLAVLTLLVVGALVAIAPATATLARASAATTEISIDGPSASATVSNGSPVDVGGWAIDTTGPGTGVDMVRVYLDGTMDGSGTLLGTATYGEARPDVATAQGSAAFTGSGYDLTWTPSGLSAGPHTLYVYAHSTSGSWADQSIPIVGSAETASQSSAATAAESPSMGSSGGYSGYQGGPGPSGMNGYPGSPAGYGPMGGYGGGPMGGYGSGPMGPPPPPVMPGGPMMGPPMMGPGMMGR